MNPGPRRLAAFCFAGVVAFAAYPATAVSFESLFAPSARLWERWTAYDANSAAAIDHAPWDRFLKTYVSQGDDGINRVAYAGVTDVDRRTLERYIAGLAATPISSFARGEQLAYWINLYNALTLKVVLDHYPVRSIRDIDISPGLFADGPWDKELLEIEGEAVSLNDIEHRILRPIWHDPRLHYAVNCASLGCPNLRRAAYTSATVDALLSAAARAYVNHARGAKLDGGSLVVSSIYDWFQEDFGGNEAGVIRHLVQFADPALQTGLSEIGGFSGHDYDWALNDASGQAPGSDSSAGKS